MCQMSTVCCKHDFEITLPPDAQRVIDALPWKVIQPRLEGTKLPVRADGKLQLKTHNETCRFLGPLGQCLVHQTLGRQPFGPCCVFPVSFAQTPEGVDVALSPICDGTRRGVGPLLTHREEDLHERLIHAAPRRSSEFRLAPGVQIPWQKFRDIETGLCDILAAEDLPLRRRFYLGCRLLGALREGEPVDIPQWLSEPATVISTELRQVIHAMLARVLGWDRLVLRSLPQQIPANLLEKEMRDAQPLAGILRNTLFCKVYSYPYDLTTAHNLIIVLYLVALMMQESSAEPLTEALWRELGSLGVHGMLKALLHDGVPEGFRNLFGTSEFGLWMLCA